jgi:hypothetical protein
MGIVHLSDDQIQAYLENKEQQNSEIMLHLESCHECQKNVQIYQNIFYGLKEAETPPLSNYFSNAVTAHLEKYQERRARLWEGIILFFIFLFAIVVSFYFVNPVPTVLDIGKLLLGGLTKSIDKVIYLLNGMLSLLLMIAAILFLFEIINKKILVSMLNQK